MKKLLAYLTAVLLFFGAFDTAEALLVDYSNSSGHVVWDTKQNIYWYWNLSDFTNKTWSEQDSAISALNAVPYYGLTDWHVATVAEMTQLWTYTYNEISSAFSPSDTVGDFTWWAGRYDHEFAYTDGSPGHYLAQLTYDGSASTKYPLETLMLIDTVKDAALGVWAASNGPNPVPEPATMLLLASGLVGLAGFRKLRKQ